MQAHVGIRERGIKQTFVAQKSNLSQQELSDSLNGRRLIKACDIPKFAFALGVTADEIYAAGRESIAESAEPSD